MAWGRPSSSATNDAGLAQAQVFGLQAGEDQVGVFGLDGGGEQPRYAQSIARAEVVADDVDGAVGALGESFADGGAHALRAGADARSTSPPCFSLSCRASSSA